MKILKSLKKITLKNLNEIDFKHKKSTAEELLKASLKKKVEVFRVFEDRFIFILKKKDKLFWISKALTSKANPVGISIARDKKLTTRLLYEIGYPVAPSSMISDISELKEAIKKIKFPVVIKPLRSLGGEGVTVNIRTKNLLFDSFRIAKKFDKKILVEKHIEGDYYRLTYIANGFYAATKNMPAYIVGDGKKTAKQLIDSENKNNKERKDKGRLKKIKISEKTKRFLATYGYTFSSIIPKSKKIPLCFSGFDGGEYIDVTKNVHPYFIKMASRISKILDLPIIGVDIITKTISKPLNKTGGVILEINGTYPDIQFHNMPTQGKPINLAPKLIDCLFE